MIFVPKIMAYGMQYFYYKSSLCIPEGMLRKARERKFVCLRKPQPAPDFRVPAAPYPRCVFGLFF